MPKPVITRSATGGVLQVLGTQVRFLCTAEETGKKWSLMEVSLPKAAGAPPHSHPWDEAYYVLTGEVRFVVGGVAHLLRAGDFLYAPANTIHAFEGHSEEMARVIIFDAPAHAENFFREIDAGVKNMPADLDKMLAVGERHQVSFAPPG
ncbi:MAG: cupin domain-containing protein [Pedobacter sp.]|nr:MAG: cupin domain-containing protein [Pedobacter sp.]